MLTVKDFCEQLGISVSGPIGDYVIFVNEQPAMPLYESSVDHDERAVYIES